MNYLPPPSTLDFRSPPALVQPVAAPLTVPYVVTAAPTPSCRPVIVAGIANLDPTTGHGLPAQGLWLDGWVVAANLNDSYVLGHNPGSGAWFFSIWPGQELCYAGHRYRVSLRTIAAHTDSSWLTTSYATPTLTLQTCVDPAGNRVVIIRAEIE
jgi:hypothetical protein